MTLAWIAIFASTAAGAPAGLGTASSPVAATRSADPAPASPDADADGDGVVDAADLCATTPGVSADGCPDGDLDGISDRIDECPAAPGDLTNGCQRELNAEIRGVWRVNGRLTKLVNLHVTAPVGSRISARCTGDRNVCPFRTMWINRTARRTTSLTRYFKDRRVFPPDTSITIRVTRGDRLGTYERLVTRSGRRLPTVVNEGCIDASGNAIRCP
jgi:hypothetical protein